MQYFISVFVKLEKEEIRLIVTILAGVAVKDGLQNGLFLDLIKRGMSDILIDLPHSLPPNQIIRNIPPRDIVPINQYLRQKYLNINLILIIPQKVRFLPIEIIYLEQSQHHNNDENHINHYDNKLIAVIVSFIIVAVYLLFYLVDLDV